MHYLKRIADIVVTVSVLGIGASYFWVLAALIDLGARNLTATTPTEAFVIGVMSGMATIGRLLMLGCSGICAVFLLVFLFTGSGILFRETKSGQLIFRLDGVLQNLKQRRLSVE